MRKIKDWIFFDSYGYFSIGFFLICVVSGVFLAIPFDVNSPYLSIGTIMIGNSWGAFFRNAHYWSAQLFLIFSVLHAWEYIKKSNQLTVKKGIWFRLTLALLVTFWVMLSGFILKADADSLQAQRILNSLLSSIPLIGKLLSYSVLGKEGDFQIIYVHHIATTTIFLAIVIFEHSKTIWGKGKTLLILILVTSLLSFIFQAPLHNNLDPVMKGPWYFLGLQEILHWLSFPGISLFLILAVLLLVYFIPWSGERRFRIFKRTLLYSFYIYLMLTITGMFFRGENWQWNWPWENPYLKTIRNYVTPEFISSNPSFENLPEAKIPIVMERKESCLICHSGMKGFSPAHNPEAIGCVSCHGGNSFTPDKEQAHKNMVLIPGNLEDAGRSCGTLDCHPDILSRVNQSLMSTLSGMINVNRFVFNEATTLSERAHVEQLGQTAADNHFRDLCAACHLGNPKIQPGPVTELSRGGGCNACHLNYSEEAIQSLKGYNLSEKKDTSLLKVHPSLSLTVSNDHCFGCHSRSGRISTNYEGWHETSLDKEDVTNLTGFRILKDERVFTFVKDDVHHRKGMDCIDCHNSYELMGDGNAYHHKETQVKILCEDCHFNEVPKTISYSSLDKESMKIVDLKKITANSSRFVVKRKSGIALTNVFLSKGDTAFLIGKNSGKVHPLKAPAEICTKGQAHDNVSCSACHTAWAPRCIGCHNAYEPQTEGFDLYANKYTKGSWIEYAGKYLAGPPTLGVEENTLPDGLVSQTVKTAVPGMVLTIDKSAYTSEKGEDQLIFKRLFAPAEAHTIQSKGRSCKSCHNDPAAIGYGEGDLDFNQETRKWSFRPKYQKNKHDRLPEDAWTGFLMERTGEVSTRGHFRPFSLEEQKKILTVGTCLVCHEEDSEIILNSLDNFQTSLSTLSNKCMLPLFK